MSTDQTPALARATQEAAEKRFPFKYTPTDTNHDRLVHTVFVQGQRSGYAAALTALHDPDGALARTLCRRIHRSLWPIASTPDPDRPGCSNCREHVDVLRAAILGADR